MKTAIVNTFDVRGGAARAASRLHLALRQAGVDATMLVAHRERADPGVAQLEPRALCRLLRLADEVRAAHALHRYRNTRPRGLDAFQGSRPWLGRMLERRMPQADVINLHWVAGMLDYASLPRLAARAPLVWTLHDMLPLTGGCHYDSGCARYVAQCGSCPQLGSRSDGDLSRSGFAIREAALARVPPDRLQFVAPSRWLAGEAERSGLCGRFAVQVIPNSLDLQVFAPMDRTQARASLGLPSGRPIVLFVADDLGNPRKGAPLLLEALRPATGEPDKRPLLVALGGSNLGVADGLECRRFPLVSDDHQLARIYAAADVLALPSLQDNLPNTMIEAMACGTPVVGFAAGGLPDMIRNGETGLLAALGDVAGLRGALTKIAGDPALARALGGRARERVAAECAPEIQARRYISLYSGMLHNASAHA
jgi:glycosyltransferase involved in cell wall biosynthesis